MLASPPLSKSNPPPPLSFTSLDFPNSPSSNTPPKLDSFVFYLYFHFLGNFLSFSGLLDSTLCVFPFCLFFSSPAKKRGLGSLHNPLAGQLSPPFVSDLRSPLYLSSSSSPLPPSKSGRIDFIFYFVPFWLRNHLFFYIIAPCRPRSLHLYFVAEPSVR